MHLRLLTLGDATELADYYHRNQAFHRDWSPLMPADYATPSVQEARLRAYFERHSRGEQYRFGIFLAAAQPERPERLIGNITLTGIERDFFQNGRLGYAVDQQWCRRGLITENLQQVMQFAFVKLGLHRLEASIMPENRASQRVLEKSGFEKIGHAPNYLQIQGVWRNHDLYARLATD
jgi:[ribosomal protein S5]-alanine N-acetyltransferase